MKKTILLTLVIAAFFLTTSNAQSIAILDKVQKHYIGKPVIAKIPLPDDKQPMLLYIDREELIDRELYNLKVERVGVGIDTGMVAIISELDIRGSEIVFRLVGVGYELPSGRIPKALLDSEVMGQGGARIRIKAGKDISEVDDLINTINGWLSNIVNTRALVSADDQPEPIQQAIAEGEVLTGMSRKAVYLSVGDPTEILREMKDGELHEAWIYEREDFTSRVVVFINGRVSKIIDY